MNHTERVNAAQNARLREQLALADTERGEFLRALDAADFAVTEFESKFLESFLSSAVPASFWTARRRDTADEMKQRYGGRL